MQILQAYNISEQNEDKFTKRIKTISLEPLAFISKLSIKNLLMYLIRRFFTKNILQIKTKTVFPDFSKSCEQHPRRLRRPSPDPVRRRDRPRPVRGPNQIGLGQIDRGQNDFSAAGSKKGSWHVGQQRRRRRGIRFHR